MRKLSVTLTDGTELGIRVTPDLVQTLFTEIPAYARPAGTISWIDGRMYFVARTELVPIRHPNYEHAASRAEGARKALEFFAESAEAVIDHARAEGIDVIDCY